MSPAERHYVDSVFAAFAALPLTTGRLSPADRRLASALYRDDVPLEIVRSALTIGLLRRLLSLGSSRARSAPVRSLSYFLGVVRELQACPPDPGYVTHVRSALERSMPRVD